MSCKLTSQQDVHRLNKITLTYAESIEQQTMNSYASKRLSTLTTAQVQADSKDLSVTISLVFYRISPKSK